jgi:hypothetical protein
MSLCVIYSINVILTLMKHGVKAKFKYDLRLIYSCKKVSKLI